jgi:predicted ester cyclase
VSEQPGHEAPKDVVRRFYAEVIDGRDVGACDRLLTEDFTHDDEPRGRAGQRVAVEAFLGGFSDLRTEILLLLAEDDLVAAHLRWTGTHDGPFAGVEATGRGVAFTSTAVLRVRGGMIAAAWDEVDLMGLLGQLRA